MYHSILLMEECYIESKEQLKKKKHFHLKFLKIINGQEFQFEKNYKLKPIFIKYLVNQILC